VKITACRQLEDCFDGSSVYCYEFDEGWTRGDLDRFQVCSHWEYHLEFPRPFFRAREKSGFEVKGVEGESNCRVVFSRKGKEAEKAWLESLFEQSVCT